MGEKRAGKTRRRRKRKQARLQKHGERLLKPESYKMYIDESGNSGSNIFDSDQPVFFTLAVISKDNLTSIEKCSLGRDRLRVEELHGNELGLRRISDISEVLMEIVVEHDLHMICTNINKIYFGKMKFFDVMFDSGSNPGVGPHHCFIRPLKLLLMVRFAEIVTLGELRHFWTAYRQNDVSSFESLMVNMIDRVGDYHTDNRTKELLLDCYKGAITASTDVLGCGLIKEDSPNVSSIVMLIHELHKLLDGRNVVVDEVIHDTQREFGVSIEEVYRVLHQVKIMWNIADFKHKRVKVFSPEFYICDSKACDGLQLCDVMLYLHKKARAKSLEGPARELYGMLSSRLHCLFMTREGLWSETELELMKVCGKPLRKSDYVRGGKVLKELESKRKARLLGHKNGLRNQGLQ